MEKILRELEAIVSSLESRLPNDEKLRKTFRDCFLCTAETTTRMVEKDDTFVFTGDIPAMWLRDSSAQVVHYLPFIKDNENLRRMVKGLIMRQFSYIVIDPYANAYNEKPDGSCYSNDRTQSNAWEWERKYEIDSLCYPVWLLERYVSQTGDTSVFTGEVHEGLKRIAQTFKTEQNHETESEYYFERTNCPASDTLERDGKGAKVNYTGLTWSGFRPSDDACKYGYLIPANMFAVLSLNKMAKAAKEHYGDDELCALCGRLAGEIQSGIEAYGIYEHEKYGRMYAYETDGFGNYNLMDDANVPSLLSLPWLGYCSADDELYKNTRSFVLSHDNPYFYEGSAGAGIGSPHTPNGYIWPIALTMQALTCGNIKEKQDMVNVLLETDGGCCLMHESFDCCNPETYTREWFAWANSLFALLVMDAYSLT